MNINEIIVIIVALFFCLGALDQLIGNKFGFGERFTEGIMTMGTLTLAMVGIISLAPVLASLLTPIVTPIYQFIGADPSSFANTLLALDMGGYALATEMSNTKEGELFSWVFLGTMMGPTIVFTIPVALGIIRKTDHPFFAQGILIGLITVPFGCFIGGVVAGFDFDLIITNLIFPIIISILIGIGLITKMEKMIAGFSIFGKLVEIVAIIGLIAITVETMTGYVVIPNLTPLTEGVQIVGTIALFLAGAFPMVKFIQLIMRKALAVLGSKLGINETSTVGLISSLAHNIPMFTILKDMDDRGKVINIAFAVSGAFVFGGHLGFVAGIEKEIVFAMIVGKLAGGISAIIVAMVVLNKDKKRRKA